MSDVNTEYLGEIGIKIHSVNQNVCKALVRSITDDSPLRGIALTGTESDITEEDCQESNDLTLYYNDNMTTTDNVNFTDPECKGVTCEGNLTCFHGECKCSDGTFPCGTECCTEGKYCVQDSTNKSQNICVAPEGGCTSNDDCDKETEFCKFSGGNCNSLGTGTCTTKVTWDSNSPYTIAGVEVYKSSSTMDWWSAKNLCQAHGKQLATMADLGISNQAGKNYCYFDHSRTTDTTLQCICNGDEGCTQTANELHQMGTSGYLWLADNSKANSCLARNVNLNLGRVHGLLRGGGSSVLCR